MVGHRIRVPRAYAEGLVVDDAVLLMLELHGQVVHTEAVRAGALVDPGTQGGIEGAQRAVVEEAEEVAEQANIQPGAFPEAQPLLESVPQFRFRKFFLPITQEGLVVQVDEMQGTAQAGLIEAAPGE